MNRPLMYCLAILAGVLFLLMPTLAFAGDKAFDIYNVVYLALVAAGGWVLNEVRSYLKTAKMNVLVKTILVRIADAADKVVPALAERKVKALKKRFGHLPPEDAVIVKQQATYEIEDILGGKKFIKKAAKALEVDTKAVELYISDAIEAKVNALNNENPANLTDAARQAVNEAKGAAADLRAEATKAASDFKRIVSSVSRRAKKQ